MRSVDLLKLTPEGLFCAAGEFHIDPMRPVARALITHGHADHARPGHGAVLATAQTLAIMAIRYGEGFCTTRQVAVPGQTLRVGEVDVSFHPAGHILGSAQILMQQRGYRAVVSGDYKRASDPTAAPFELVRCDMFVTEATFGLPIFTHPPAATEMEKLLASLALFSERTHMVGAYTLGKAQRVMAELRRAGYDRPIRMHGAVEALTAFYAAQGVELGQVEPVDRDAKAIRGGVVICPPSALGDRWSRRFADPVACFASGWMRTRARARQRGVELPLIISDHVDWPELTRTVKETGCSELWVTHGQEDALVHWAQGEGIDARPLRLLGYGDEGEGDAA